MNQDILRDAHPHIRMEHEKLRAELRALESGLGLAVAALLDEMRGAPAVLEGAPALDAHPLEWLDFFVARGAGAALAGIRAEQPALFEAVA